MPMRGTALRNPPPFIHDKQIPALSLYAPAHTKSHNNPFTAPKHPLDVRPYNKPAQTGSLQLEWVPKDPEDVELPRVNIPPGFTEPAQYQGKKRARSGSNDHTPQTLHCGHPESELIGHPGLISQEGLTERVPNTTRHLCRDCWEGACGLPWPGISATVSNLPPNSTLPQSRQALAAPPIPSRGSSQPKPPNALANVPRVWEPPAVPPSTSVSAPSKVLQPERKRQKKSKTRTEVTTKSKGDTQEDGRSTPQAPTVSEGTKEGEPTGGAKS